MPYVKTNIASLNKFLKKLFEEIKETSLIINLSLNKILKEI